jgi:hypothetical protein
MKTIIMIIMLISTPLFTQNFEPTQKKFKWGSSVDSIYISADSTYFRQTKPIIGWHWGGSYKLSKSLLTNQNDAFRHWEKWGYSINDFVDSCQYNNIVGQIQLQTRIK